MNRPLVAILVAAFLAASATAETTRTLRADLALGAPARFAVENLAGKMVVRAGGDDRVEVVATVHAETSALADTVRIDQVRGKEGELTLRVRYPLADYRKFHYPQHGNSTVEYDGRSVRVSSSGGVLLYADVVVTVPRRDVEATFRNLVGSLEAEGASGSILLDSASGPIEARDLRGSITADTGSGDVDAERIEGSFNCDTGSGGCRVSGFSGERLSCDTGSGRIRLADITANKVLVDTGSGGVAVEGADIESFDGDTGSGDIDLEVTGTRLRSVRADAGSGRVTVRLPEDSAFELTADVGSGDITSRFRDAEPILHRRELIGWRRGEGGIMLSVSTGSGDVVLEPTVR